MSFQDSVVVVGHRGAAGLAPENTLPSFRRAWACGVSAVELDVQLLDGRLVVIHDERLERTTNGVGAVTDLNLTELRALDAGDGAPIPFLEEVMAELPAGTGVNVELKGPGTAEPVAELLADMSRAEVLVSAFDHEELRRFHRRAPEWPVAPLFHRWRPGVWRTAESFDAWSVNLNQRIATRYRLAHARRRNLRVLVYTVNDLEEARRLVSWGATGVFTDYPDRITRQALAPFAADTVVASDLQPREPEQP